MTGNKINWNNIHHVEQLLADAGEIYTLSNQGSGSQIQYNYLHDISASSWADYWINGLYLDEGTSGYDVSHNVFKSAPSGVACNSCGSYTSSDNTGSAASTISGAGIESAYSDISSKLTIPLPNFAASTGLIEGAARTSNRSFSAAIHEGLLTIRIAPEDAGRAATLSVYDLDGACVARYNVGAKSSEIHSFDFSKAPAGHYFAVLQSDKSLQSSPFVKPQGDLR
jgi:hypothetical protein